MNESLSLIRNKIETDDGETVRLVYEQETDILEIFFGENEVATGIELTDQILLRIDRQTKRAVSLTIRHFSILTEQTEYGPRSYPLDNLAAMPDEPRELVLTVLKSAPVNYFLKLAHFQSTHNERIPFTYVDSKPMLAAA